ncbi:hypothetical protein ABH926_007914 [Catenulispora sp. GP43]|uniref:hypothetical protein n=1 Tax=Catenulispora sp. GP43 TaxID=3156263 RepID=UPI0035172C34
MGDQKTPMIPMPDAPATALWEISLAAYLRRRTDLPSLALKPLGLLDRYGEVAVGPDHVAFDGEDVPWDKAVRVIVRDVVEVVSDAAMAREAEKIRHMLPPVPGRKWVVDHAMVLLGEFAGPRLTKTRGGDVVSEIVYRGALGREKTLQAGVFAALVMATWPDVRHSLVATARAHGVEVYGETVRQADPGVPAPVGHTVIPPQHAPDDAPTLIIPAQSEPSRDEQPAGGVVLPPGPGLWTPAEPQPEG